MNLIQNFLHKIDKIVLVVGSTSESEVEELKKNLLASLYLDLTTKIGLNPINKELLDQLSINPSKTVEDIDKKVAFAQEKLKETGFNFDKAVEESTRTILEGFVKEFEPSLSPEKILDLQKIIIE